MVKAPMILDIKRLKTRVEEQRSMILSRMKRLRREDPFKTEDRSLIVEPGTDASALFGHEQTVVLEEQLKGDLLEIERALSKIKDGTYGVCESCGKKIDSNRLSVKPASIYCLKCENEIEKKHKKAL